MANTNKPHSPINRPCIGDSFLSKQNEVLFVAAIWSGGVVFEGGPAVSTTELNTHYKPKNKNTTDFLRGK